MPVPVAGLDWSVGILGQGLCPGGCAYCVILGTLGIPASAPVTPTLLLCLIAVHLFLCLCYSCFSLCQLSAV